MRNLNRAIVYFRQFRFFEALTFLLSDIFRRIVDPSCVTSYSQTGEDKFISHFFVREVTGFYVDVGCNHPQKFSNTFLLYKRGWKGVVIDANSDLIAMYRKRRPRDLAVCALVSSNAREMNFTEFEDTLISSVEPSHVALWEGVDGRKVKSERAMHAVTLNKILDENAAPARFELLTIDVEGHDFEVLKSLDLSRFRPRLIVIEMHGFEVSNSVSNTIVKHLVDHDYAIIGFAVDNGYFADCNK